MRRDVPLSAKTTQEERDMLNFMTTKFERSQGFLIGKMIKRGYSEILDKDKPEEKAKRSKLKSYPKNLDDQFELLWEIKGKKGTKNGPRGAYNKFKKLAEAVSEEGCENFTKMLIEDILKHQHEVGYPEMHLTTYLNNQRWER